MKRWDDGTMKRSFSERVEQFRYPFSMHGCYSLVAWSC